MKVFLTSATGYVGAEIAKLLKADGHSVVGLARSQQSADKLRTAGIEPVSGDLRDVNVLSKAAAAADAVIHTAYAHAGDYGEAMKMDAEAIRAMTDALAGSNRPFIISSATGFLGNTGDAPVSEEYPIDPEMPLRFRCQAERDTIQAVGKGVRAVVLRLPPFVWGNGGSTFIPVQIETARRLGKAYYILPGDQKTCGVHIEDLARAYVLALQHAPAGSVYHVITSNDTSIRSIAEAVASNVGVPVEGVSLEEAQKREIWPAWMALIWSYNNRPSSEKAQRELGWGKFKAIDMLDDIKNGSYKQAA